MVFSIPQDTQRNKKVLLKRDTHCAGANTQYFGAHVHSTKKEQLKFLFLLFKVVPFVIHRI